MALQNIKTAQQEKAIALQEKDMVRQKMAAALAELERLKAQLGKQDPSN